MPAKTFIDRPDLLDSESPPGLRVVQLTADADHPFCHVYMEAQVFSSDSQRFLIRRSRMAHNHTLNDPDYQYHLCDLDAQEISPLTNELNVCAPSFSPDDQWVYYLTDDAQSGGAVALRRVRPDGTGRETLRVYDQPLSGADVPLRLIYPLSTMSSDGRYLVTGAGVGVERDPWGIVRFDLATGEAMVIWRDPFIRNSHPQYCRSHDPQRRRDLLIQRTTASSGTRPRVRRSPTATTPAERTSTSSATMAVTSGRCRGVVTGPSTARAISAGEGAAAGPSPAR